MNDTTRKRLKVLGKDPANLSGPNLSGTNLSGTNLRWANLSGANLSGADLSEANLSEADLSGTNLSGTNLSGTNLSGTNLSGTNLSGADLRWANLSGANLSGADLSEANLSGADLSGADLSGAAGLLNAADWLAENFQIDEQGRLIVYRAGNGYKSKPDGWKILPGEWLAENAHSDRAIDCACGVSFATIKWICRELPDDRIMRCAIEPRDWPGIVVPYNTGGKARCERLLQLEWID